MTRGIRSGAGVVAVFLFFGACGSRDEEPPVPLGDLARVLADALCDNIGPCCQESGFPHDPTQCHSAAETQLRTEIARTTSTPNVVYDANAARACVNAYTAAIKACEPVGRANTAACEGVFVGTLQPGEPCTMPAECARGGSCTDTGDTTKHCTGSAAVRGKLGDSCSATCTETADATGCFGTGGAGGGTGDGGALGPAECYTNDGLYCDSANICASAPGIGQACMLGTACAGEAFCDNGVCAAKRTTGPCGQFSDGCASTSYCDVGQQCQPRKPTGADCASSFECASTDTCAGTCRKRSIASAERCKGDF